MTQDRRVSLLMDKDGYIVHSGDLSVVPKKELVNVIIEGGQIKTVTLQQFQKKKDSYKWIWDKPKNKKP